MNKIARLKQRARLVTSVVMTCQSYQLRRAFVRLASTISTLRSKAAPRTIRNPGLEMQPLVIIKPTLARTTLRMNTDFSYPLKLGNDLRSPKLLGTISSASTEI
jgi:hypothetical protein